MRGPGYKLSGDVRRTWRCPACGRQQKLSGEVTALSCSCEANQWMQIVAERNNAPRPVQNPSDIERRPIDFGIEPIPQAPQKPEATIIKGAIDVNDAPEPTSVAETSDEPSSELPAEKPSDSAPTSEDEWGEGIL